jgi:hypothetical protein
MRLHDRKPGTATIFVDSSSGEGVLQLGADSSGRLLIAYRLYDRKGDLVASTEGFEDVPAQMTVKCKKGEVLLDLPKDPAKHIRYRLYGATGQVLTWSDGVKTKIYGSLRMDGVGHGWVPPKNGDLTNGSK